PENVDQIASGTRKTASASAATSPAESTAPPAVPGRKLRSASGPPIDATANPSTRRAGRPLARLPPGSVGRTPAMGQPQTVSLVVDVVPGEPAVAGPATCSEVLIPSAACPGIGHQSEIVPPASFTVFVRVAPGAIVPTATVP